jgi:dGTPase
MIDFTTKINPLRNYNKETRKPFTHSELKATPKTYKIEDLEVQLESDRGRIIGSAALRRLQQKTQVFPLERNAAVRSRLTHSLEVQQNGRYIVKTIFKNLSNELKKEYKLEGLEVAIESIVEMACLIHDIGNPPFGHFGEGALIDWFNKNTTDLLNTCIENPISNSELKNQIITDLQNFEGNAQALRLIHSLQRMNLTFVQSACILKYHSYNFHMQ